MIGREIATVGEKLAEAVELGDRMRAIRAEWRLWILSRAAWDRMAHLLAPNMPADAWEQLAKYPNLAREVQIRGELWTLHRQDRPALFNFAMGDRDPVVHAELLHSNLTSEDCSRLASELAAELRDANSWGSADSLDDGPAALAPHEARLLALDAELFRVVTLPCLAWVAGKPVLRHEGIDMEISEHTARRLATELAERMGQRVTLAA